MMTAESNANKREIALGPMLTPTRSQPPELEGFTWLRGPATYADGWLELDPLSAELYAPAPGGSLLRDLTGVRAPADAVAFVEAHGLLTRGIEEPFGRPYRHAADLREAFQDWETHVSRLHAAAKVYRLMRRAMDDHDPNARTELRDYWWPNVFSMLWSDPEDVPEGDEGLLWYAGQFAAYTVSLGLEGVQEGLGSGRVKGADTFEVGFFLRPQPTTLVGLAYHQLAVQIVGRVPIKECAECARVFEVEDKRQQFCSKKCGSRSRYRRWKEKEADNDTTRKQ